VSWISDARNQDTLILSFIAHVNPCTFRNRKYVWWIIIPALVAILLDNDVCVEGEALVGINGDKK
jgi:hypothetical protein